MSSFCVIGTTEIAKDNHPQRAGRSSLSSQAYLEGYRPDLYTALVASENCMSIVRRLTKPPADGKIRNLAITAAQTGGIVRRGGFYHQKCRFLQVKSRRKHPENARIA